MDVVAKEKANNPHQQHLWNINSDKDFKNIIYHRFKNKWEMNTKLNEIKNITDKWNNPMFFK